MPKRKLIEITPAQFQKFDRLRQDLRKRGLRVPSMPFLVQTAIDRGIESVISENTLPMRANER